MIVGSLEARMDNDRVRRAAKAARINISSRVEVMIPDACWPLINPGPIFGTDAPITRARPHAESVIFA